MRKLLLSLSLLVMTAITAMAQYTVTIESAPENGYFSGSQSFDAEEIATALGYANAEALFAAFENESIVYIKGADGELTNVYTGNKNEFWLNGEAIPQGYGDEGTCFFVGVYGSDAAVVPAELVFRIGQMPNFFKYDPFEAHFPIYLVNGDRQVEFNVNFKVLPLDRPSIAEPSLSYETLEIVKEYEATMNFVIGKPYGDIPVEIDFAGAAEALEVSEADLAGGIEDVLLTRTYKTMVAEEGSYVSGSEIADELVVLVSTNDGWVGRYDVYDEQTDQTTVYPLNGSKSWGAGCTVYMHNPVYKDGVLSLTTGQYPGTFTETGVQNDIIELYVVNGTKALKITLKVNITEPEAVPFEEMTKADEVTFDLEAEYQPSSYITQPLTVDIAAIAEAIGVEASDIDDFYTWASEGVLVNDHNESSGGYFWKEDGYLGSWGASTSAFYIAVSGKVSDGNYLIAQMPGSTAFEGLTEPKTVSSQILFLGLEKYYVVNINFTVKPKEEFQGDKNKVGDESLAIQIVPTDDMNQWAWGVTTPLDLEYIESKIGTQSFKLYSINKKTVKNDDETVTVTYEWSDLYNCDPNPGFWYKLETAESGEYQGCVLAQGWGDNSFGLTYAGGEITWYQYPGLRQAGDSYKTHIFLMNEANGKYLDYTIYVEYVEETGAQVETVGTGELEHIVTAAEAAEVVFTIDLDTNEMFEALGLDAETVDAASVVAPKSSTTYVTTSFGESLGYNTDGYFVGVDDEENCTLQAVVEANDGAVQVSFDLMDLAFAGAEELTIPVRLGFEYDGKRYMYIITLTNKQPLDAKRLPLTGGSGAGSEMAIEVLETNEDGEPLAATYTITNGTWGNNASHLSLFKYAPLSADVIEGYNGAVVVFAEDVPSSEGNAYGWIPAGFVCPAGWINIENTDKFVYTFSDEEKAKGIEDYSIFFNASGTLKDCTVTIKGLYLVTDVNATVEEIEAVGIKNITPAAATTAAPAGVYTLSGVKVGALQHGLNIVKMADGSVKKILVK